MAHESPYAEAAALSERSDAAHPGGEWFADLTAGTRLTRKGAEIAHFLAVNPRLASFGSASEIAAHLGVNVATVVRFAQALGFGVRRLVGHRAASYCRRTCNARDCSQQAVP